MANLKNITDLPVAESADGLNLIVNDNGSAKQIAASAVGAQADWDVTDETNPAFIKNKPFYDTREYDTTTVTFDGDMTGKETVEMEVGATYYVKVSDETPTQDEFIGNSMSFVNEGVVDGSEVTSDAIQVLDFGFLIANGYVVVVNTTEGQPFTSTGIWVVCLVADGAPISYTSELSWTALVSGEFKQLEAKYVAGLEELMTSVVTVYSGTATPTADVGENGDVYLVTEG